MKTVLPVIVVLALSLSLLAGLFAARPFAKGSAVLDHLFGAPPEWTQVSSLAIDPETQELSQGEKPLKSFRILARAWGREPDSGHVLIIGNSQTLAMSLSPGEAKPTSPEYTWPDLVAQDLRAGLYPQALCYRLAAPGMSYAEALWYVEYLDLHREIRPDVLVLQLNYQSFWNGGVRPGMLELLHEPDFRAAIRKESRSQLPYAETFAQALRDFASSPEQAGEDSKAKSGVRLAGMALAPGFEKDARASLDRIPAFQARHEQKGDLIELLYRARIYLLRLKPTTARTIDGTRFQQARACLLRILSFCQDRNIQPVFFSAPVNPLVYLYRTSADRERFDDCLREMETQSGTRILRLEDAIPARLWGRQFDGPDPLHMGRQGHARFAELMAPPIAEALRKSAAGRRERQRDPHVVQ
jgi:lysophospholipase L1-like esterase